MRRKAPQEADIASLAWLCHSPDFVAEFEFAQQAFAVGDLDHVVSRLCDQSAAGQDAEQTASGR